MKKGNNRFAESLPKNNHTETKKLPLQRESRNPLSSLPLDPKKGEVSP